MTWPSSRMEWPSADSQHTFKAPFRLLPHQSEIDRMAPNNASRQIFVEKRIVKELTIIFWSYHIQTNQAENLKAALRTHARYIENFIRRLHRIRHRQIYRSLKYHCRQFIEKYAKCCDTSIFWHPDVIAAFPDLLELTPLPRIFNETYTDHIWKYPEYSYTL